MPPTKTRFPAFSSKWTWGSAQGFGQLALDAANWPRVLLTGSATNFWSVGELNLYGTTGTAPLITSPSSLVVQPGAYTVFTLTATGSPVPVLSEPGSLPSGLTFSAGTHGTATVSGTTPAYLGGTYQVTVTASSSAGTATQYLMVTLTGRAAVITSPSVWQVTPGPYLPVAAIAAR